MVDDFEPWRQRICNLLQTYPDLLVVAEVGDGLEAVQKAELQPDLIVLDIGLPNLNGLEAAKRILQVAPATSMKLSIPKLTSEMLPATSATRLRWSFDKIFTPREGENGGPK